MWSPTSSNSTTTKTRTRCNVSRCRSQFWLIDRSSSHPLPVQRNPRRWNPNPVKYGRLAMFVEQVEWLPTCRRQGPVRASKDSCCSIAYYTTNIAIGAFRRQHSSPNSPLWTAMQFPTPTAAAASHLPRIHFTWQIGASEGLVKKVTSHTSREPWPWNCESPKESVQRPPSQHTSMIIM